MSKNDPPEMDSLTQTLDAEIKNWQTENPRTDSVQATPPAPRKPLPTTQAHTIKLTTSNLAAHTASQQPISPAPKPLIDSQFRFNPTPGVTKYRIKRKPLSDEAQAALTKYKEESSGVVVPPPPPPSRDANDIPPVSRTDTHFEQLVPAHQVGSWKDFDDGERRARSISAVATEGVRKVKKWLRE
jgi:hypothetical protein